MKAKTLFVFYRYKELYSQGQGLIANDIAEILSTPLSNAFDSIKNYQKWKYINVGITRNGRSQRIYRLASKGEQWLIRWNSIIPWAGYGWTVDTIAEIDRKISEIVRLRGYQ